MKSTLTSSLALLLLSTASCWAQATEAEMRAFPMPPTKGWDVISPFNGPTNQWFGYWLRPLSSRSTMGGGAADDYSYVIYYGSGLQASRTGVFWGDWGSTPIPPPERPGDPNSPDACPHSHLSYGVWGYVRTHRLFDYWTLQWEFLGGGSLAGMRDANSTCVHAVDTPLARIDPRYGWGVDAMVIDMTGGCSILGGCLSRTYDYIVLGVLNNTHGWGSCGSSSFVACIEPGRELGYAVP